MHPGEDFMQEAVLAKWSETGVATFILQQLEPSIS